MTDEHKKEDLVEAGAFTLGGMVGGGVLSGIVGHVGLAVGSTAISVGLVPIVAVGAMTGLAMYGSKKAIDSSGLKEKSAELLDQIMPAKKEESAEGAAAK